ncbi:replicative DNA helicase [Peptostreptococcus stomatis DSM 17678]|uniref:DNA 5'-3' helicase n=2 Tax=Peptostreptococcus TaxID=1257 RepID=E0E1I0_9FIRM|nr:replicative DNA helicase [Peptostreptococcus stomatis DSM 17678]
MELNISKELSDYELEAGVIGDIIVDAKLMIIANDNGLSEDDFGFEHLSQIYKCIRKLYITKKPIDIISVKNGCDRVDLNIDMSYLSELVKYSIGSNFEYKIKLIKELACKRDVLYRLKCIGQNINKKNLSDIENEVKSISDIFSEKGTVDDLILDASEIDLIDDRDGLKTGFKNLDKVLNGLKFGTLTILTGEPSSGKSTLLNQIIAENISSGNKAFIYSGELTGSNVLRWFIDTVANVNDLQEYKSMGGTYYSANNHGQYAIKEWIKDRLFIFNENKSPSISNIGMTIEYLARVKNVKLFIIDNLMMIDRGQFEEFEKQKELAKILKNLAKKYKISVILVAHPRKKQSNLSLKNTKESYHMHDVSGASEVVNLADYEILISRDIGEDKNGNKYDTTKIIVLKNRITGKQRAKFDINFDIMRRRFWTDKDELNKDYGYDNMTIKKQVKFVELESIADDIPF